MLCHPQGHILDLRIHHCHSAFSSTGEYIRGNPGLPSSLLAPEEDLYSSDQVSFAPSVSLLCRGQKFCMCLHSWSSVKLHHFSSPAFCLLPCDGTNTTTTLERPGYCAHWPLDRPRHLNDELNSLDLTRI
ncbi:hypothetical protein OE88DRAFT_853004 [Heliocybe sulcata]|uniref:Uncharacterized protein n=1 Tax=Heliocybe sulcata TaxID=5364 RepID=A0A5C3MP33_9AGAM|nr:hypothetical protein OE88DRAFT_853004 [Heliocybe sulcata]